MREFFQQILSNLPSILVFGAVLARVWDRHRQRKALLKADPELRKQLTDSLPPINTIVLLAIGFGLLAQLLVWQMQERQIVREAQPAKCLDCRDDCSCKNGQCKCGARPVPTSSLAKFSPLAGPLPTIALDL